MQYYTIHLPVKTYVRKYLQTTYGHPIILDGRTEFSDVILANLSSTLHSNLSATDIDSRLNRFTDHIDIKIPLHYWYRIESTFNQNKVVRINRYFENKFENDMYDIVNRSVAFVGLERKTAIEYFANNHSIDIEIDITYDALKKMEYRLRKDREEKTKKLLHGLSPANLMFN